MDIKKFLPAKDEEREYFWSLVIEPGWVQAGIWRIDEDKAQVVLSSPPITWETDSDLVQSADDALSAAIQRFPEDNSEPTKCVFGVPASWVDDGEISSDYLEKIKKICSELSIKPIGFVVIPEAIAYYVKSEEGGPLTAVSLGVYNQVLELSLFKLGNVSGSTSISRSVSVVDDVIEGFARLVKGENIPSRFVLYDGREGELEETRQTLLKVNWEDYENLKLLHTPKIELIDSKTKVYAVCLAGASELANVSKVEVMKTKMTEEVESDEELESSEEIKITGKGPVGMTPEALGFEMERDISKGRSEKSVESDTDNEVTHESDIDDTHRNILPAKEAKLKKKVSVGSLNIFANFKSFLETVASFFKSLKFPKSKFRGPGKNAFVYGVGFLILLAILGFVAWWYLPKSEVTVYVSPKRLEETYNLTVEVDGSTDYTQRVISGNLIREEIEGEKTKDTTGVKTVGDKTKGEVVIYRVGNQITLNAGTTLSGPESLKFTLDSEATIASGSASSPGTTKVNVTAEDIGAQYNLASGTEFSVGNYSNVDMEAKNEDSFSGGSSREINAVSIEDQEALQEDLGEELEEKAIGLVKKDLGEEEYFIEESLSATASARTFSAKVGDEANSLKLNLIIEATGISVNQKELVEQTVEVLKDKVPQGFALRGEQIDFRFELDRVRGNVYQFEVRVVVNLLPGVNTDEIIQKIKGRQLEYAQDYMKKEVPGFVRVEIKMKQTFPGKLKTLPHVIKNIELEVAAER